MKDEKGLINFGEHEKSVPHVRYFVTALGIAFAIFLTLLIVLLGALNYF